MERVVFPCILIAPDFEEAAVSAGDFTVLRRLHPVSTFDAATLGANHRLRFSWHLIEPFLSLSRCEIEVRHAGSYEAAQDRVRLFQTMLYLDGLSPFLIPFGATHSANEYAGINSRDSNLLRDKLPPELRDGLTSATGQVEIWPHELTLGTMNLSSRQRGGLYRSSVTSEMVTRAAGAVAEWAALEQRYGVVKAARAALMTAPIIPDRGSSLLHLWQGIEALFPEVRSEVSFRLSLLVAQLGSPLAPAISTYDRTRASYKHRSNAAHGNPVKVSIEHWEEAWELLRLCLRAVLKRGELPGENALILELLQARSSRSPQELSASAEVLH